MKRKTITASIRELSEGQSAPFTLDKYFTVLSLISRLKKKGIGDYMVRTVDQSILRVTCLRKTPEKDLYAGVRQARLLKVLRWLKRHSESTETGSLAVMIEGTSGESSRMTLSGIPVLTLKRLLEAHIKEELRLLREES